MPILRINTIKDVLLSSNGNMFRKWFTCYNGYNHSPSIKFDRLYSINYYVVIIMNGKVFFAEPEEF